jgi:hypothetical protein
MFNNHRQLQHENSRILLVKFTVYTDVHNNMRLRSPRAEFRYQKEPSFNVDFKNCPYNKGIEKPIP